MVDHIFLLILCNVIVLLDCVYIAVFICGSAVFNSNCNIA